MNTKDARAALLGGVSQFEVDFVIPRVGVDLPLGIDPFLLYKSRVPEHRELHDTILEVFNAGVDAVRREAFDEARRILDFPEVAAIGLGYAAKDKRGSGVGSQITQLILETLAASPSLQRRGVQHIEEMQLVSVGIGPDRISDIAANILKRFLITYTQRQCDLWNIPLAKAVPIEHLYDSSMHRWEDVFEDLPVSPYDSSPILLVPRRLVRSLPWINYDDFLNGEFRAYLTARRTHRQGGPGGTDGAERKVRKQEVVSVTRNDIELIDRYVKSRESRAVEALPDQGYIGDDACKEARTLKAKLQSTPRGREDAAAYQKLVLEVLNFLFNPDLTDGQLESRTVDGTERRDIVFTNESDEPFWTYVRSNHDGLLVMFEVKNVQELDSGAINQAATYLGDRLGRLGFIVTRVTPSEAILKKTYSVWNDSAPNRKAILILSDDDIAELLDEKCHKGSPTRWMQRKYRHFRTALQ